MYVCLFVWYVCSQVCLSVSVCVCVIARYLCDKNFVFMRMGIPVCISLYIFVLFMHMYMRVAL